MKEGFVSLSRKFFTNFLWEENRELSRAEAFIDLIQRAAFSNHKQMVNDQLIELGRGEQVASIRYLASRWNWSKAKAERYLNMLETETMVRRETRHGQTILTLCKYETYNVARDTDRDSDTQKNKTGKGQAKDTDRDKGEEGKEGEQRKQESEVRNPAPSPSPPNSHQEVMGKVNSLNPKWQKPAHWSSMELHDFHASIDQFYEMDDADWDLIKKYFQADVPNGAGYWKPLNRSKFIQSLGDVYGHAQRWAEKQGISTGSKRKLTEAQLKGLA